MEKAQVITLSSGANYVVFLERFFPSIADNADEAAKIKEKNNDVSELTPCQVNKFLSFL